MAVGVTLDFEGATLDQYDEVCGLMGLTPLGEGPPGAIFHWVTKTDNGIRVTDVWQDQATFEKFGEEQIGPFTQKVGLPNPPVINFFPVHNYLTAG